MFLHLCLCNQHLLLFPFDDIFIPYFLVWLWWVKSKQVEERFPVCQSLYYVIFGTPAHQLVWIIIVTCDLWSEDYCLNNLIYDIRF